MKTIKIIDLLNKIANGEEVPKKIKLNEIIFEYEGEDYLFIDKDNTNYWLFSEPYSDKFEYLENFLKSEVEILEEKKLPEKLEEIGKVDYNLEYIDYKNIEVLKTWLNSDIQSILNELDLIVKNQNQLIDYLESKEKGE